MFSTRRALAAAAIVAAITCGLPPRASATAPGPLGDLQQQLSSFARTAPGHVAVMVEDLVTGYSTAINAAAPMPAASTIKIPVMIEVFRKLSQCAFDLNRPVTLMAEDRDWGWGDLADAAVGTRYPVARLLSLMITESDNTATNMLIRLVGRHAINQTMQDLGLRQTWLADSIRSEGPIRSALRSSPADMVRMLEAMAKDQLIDEWSSREMIAILAGQHHNTLLPVPLPAGIPIAHKTGSLHDTLNDVGVVYLADEPYAIAVMTTDLPSLDAGRSFIHGVSKLAFRQLARFETWRETNLPTFEAIAIHSPALPGPDLRMWSPPAGVSGGALPDDGVLVTDGETPAANE